MWKISHVHTHIKNYYFITLTMGYTPPALRNKETKKIVLPQPKEKFENKEKLMEYIRLQNYGKADEAWGPPTL